MGRRFVLFAVIGLLVSGIALAQNGHPSAKATAMAGNLNILSTAEGYDTSNFTTIMSNTIKTSRKSGLFVDVSMECGLFTKTTVRSKGGNKSTSSASAMVQVLVSVDGQEAVPGPVTFCDREQELSATFQGIIDGCSVDENGVLVLEDSCLLDEEVELMTRTMNANSYGFILNNVGTGVHNIEVKARMVTSDPTEAVSATSEARAMIGKGSVTVEEIRMISGEEYEVY